MVRAAYLTNAFLVGKANGTYTSATARQHQKSDDVRKQLRAIKHRHSSLSSLTLHLHPLQHLPTHQVACLRFPTRLASLVR